MLRLLPEATPAMPRKAPTSKNQIEDQAERSDLEGRDHLGYPIEARTLDIESFLAEETVPSITAESIEIGQTLPRSALQQTGPNGSTVWFVSGPKGSRCNKHFRGSPILEDIPMAAQPQTRRQ
jgi:hypothetical protein